jgi:hypothetical protein
VTHQVPGEREQVQFSDEVQLNALDNFMRNLVRSRRDTVKRDRTLSPTNSIRIAVDDSCCVDHMSGSVEHAPCDTGLVAIGTRGSAALTIELARRMKQSGDVPCIDLACGLRYSVGYNVADCARPWLFRRIPTASSYYLHGIILLDAPLSAFASGAPHLTESRKNSAAA